MAKLPSFEQLGTREPSPQTGAVSYQATSGMEEAPGAAASKFGEQVQQIAFQQQDQLNTTRAEDAWNTYKSTAMDLAVGNNGFATKRAGAAVNGNLFQTYTGQLGEARKALEQSLTDADVRRKFAERANVTDLQFKDQLLRHYTTERDAYEKQTFDGSMAAAGSMVAAAPLDQGIFDTALLNATRRAQDLAAHQGVTDKDELAKITGNVRDTLLSKRLDALIYTNPVQADQLFRMTQDQIQNPELRLHLQSKIREASLGVSAVNTADAIMAETRATPRAPRAIQYQPPAPGFEGAVMALLKREGGYVAKDGKSGAPANYGINQAANPDIDVKNLTPEAAKNIYKTRYWDAIGGDNLPPATAMVALDTAALQGVGTAKKLITDTGGDPQAMIDTRRSQLQALAARDPEQAKNLPGWMARLDGLEAQVVPLPPNTSGLPNSRDIRAQLPIMLGKVEEKANALYGTDTANPDRAAFIARTTNELRGKINLEATQLDAIQKQAQSTLIDYAAGFKGNAPVTSMSQIQSNPEMYRAWQMTDPGARLGIQRLIESNARGDNGNDALYWKVFNRIHADPGTADKIDFYQQILPYAGPGGLNMREISMLRNEIDRNETPGGRSVGQLMKTNAARVEQFFRTNVMFTAQPDRQIAATMRWTEDVGKKIDDLVKAGHPEQVRELFQLDSKNSVISPSYLQTYVNSTPAQGLADNAAKIRQQDPSAFLKPGETLTILNPATADKQWADLPPGAPFRDPDGNLRRKTAPPAPMQETPAGAVTGRAQKMKGKQSEPGTGGTRG